MSLVNNSYTASKPYVYHTNVLGDKSYSTVGSSADGSDAPKSVGDDATIAYSTGPTATYTVTYTPVPALDAVDQRNGVVTLLADGTPIDASHRPLTINPMVAPSNPQTITAVYHSSIKVVACLEAGTGSTPSIGSTSVALNNTGWAGSGVIGPASSYNGGKWKAGMWYAIRVQFKVDAYRFVRSVVTNAATGYLPVYNAPTQAGNVVGSQVIQFFNKITTAEASPWPVPWEAPAGTAATYGYYYFKIRCPKGTIASLANATPANGTEGLATTVTVSWVGGDGVAPSSGCSAPTVEYEVQYAAVASNGTTPTTWSTKSAGTSKNTSLSGLNQDQWYAWRVIASSSEATNSPITTGWWWFKTLRPNLPPTITYGTGTPNGVTCLGLLPRILTWSGSDPDGDPITYNVYFNGNLVLGGTTLTSWTTPALQGNTTYTWRVDVKDSPPSGTSLTTTGPTWTFKTESDPTAVSLSSPSNNAIVNAASGATLVWTGGDSPDNCSGIRYTLYLDQTTNPSTVVGSNLTNKSLTVSNLQHGVWYYWKVVVTNTLGVTKTSAVWRFLLNRPPVTPHTPFPTHQNIEVPVSIPQLTWECSDPDGDSILYDVYFGTSATPPLVASGITLKNWTIPTGTLQWNTRYYWKIVASDTWSTTTGPIWWFVCNRYPGEPYDPVPYDGKRGVLPDITFEWKCDDPDIPWGDSLSFRIYAKEETWGSFMQVGATTQFYCKPPFDFTEGVWVTWYVVARDSWGLETTGPTWTFKVNRSPVPPFNPYPPDDYRLALPIETLSWDCYDPDGDELHFEIYIDKLLPTTIPPQPLSYPTTVNNLVVKDLFEFEFTTPAGMLSRSVRHFWRVKAIDSNGGWAWSPIWTFVVNYAPNVPFSPKPAHNAKRVHPTAFVSCKATDPDL